MAVLKVVHPPTGADPIAIIYLQPGLEFLIFPVLCGSVFLVLVSQFQQRLNKRVITEKFND